MKTSRRILALVVCLALVLSVSVAAFADASITFFTRVVDSFKCTGRGSIVGQKVNANFTATALEGYPVMPDEAYQSTIDMLVHTSDGKQVGISSGYGNTRATVTYNASKAVVKIECEYRFAGKYIGTFVLYNS